MHATPSEIAMTQALFGMRINAAADLPPEKLSPEYIREHSGDKHGLPDAHRVQFPDGRVGSHSALAAPQDGQELLDAAAKEIAQEFIEFTKLRRARS